MEVLFKTKNKDSPFTPYLFGCLRRELEKDKSINTPDVNNIVIIAFKELAEYIGYDVRTNSQGCYFDAFMENNMFSLFLDYIKQDRPNPVKVQIIQSLSIILQNVKSPIVFNYLYSGNHINEFISTPLDFENEEILSIYIAFVKYLSNVVNNQTIHLFFNQSTKGDPFLLFSMSIRFYDHKEAIIRTHVRNIILNCLRIKDPEVQAYMSSETVLFQYEKFVLYTGSLIKGFNQLYKQYIMNPAMKSGRLEQCADEISDQLTFYHDLLDIGVKEVNERICNTLFLKILYPSSFDSIIRYIKQEESLPNEIDVHVALYALTQVLLDVKYPYLIQKILSSLLSPYMLQPYKSVKSRKSSFHIPKSLADDSNVFSTPDLEYTYPTDSPTEIFEIPDDLLESSSPYGAKSGTTSIQDPGMRGALIALIGDPDECVSIQTMLLFYTIFTNSSLPADYLSLFTLDNITNPITHEAKYNAYLIDMIFKTLSRPQIKPITIKISIWLLKYLFRDVKQLLSQHVEAFNYILALYSVTIFNSMFSIKDRLLYIYVLSLYTVYTMRTDLKVEVQQCIYMLPALSDDSVPMHFDNRICTNLELYLQQRIEIYMQLRRFYFELYSQFKIPQVTAIFSAPKEVQKPLITATSIPKIYPQCSIYDIDMYKINNIPLVVEGQTIEINRVNRYISCNIIPPTSDLTVRAPSNKPCYLAIGRTQFILLDLVKGSLKEGICTCAFFINEIIEAEIEEGGRILVLKVRSPVYLSSTTYSTPSSDIYNRKSIPIYILRLLFLKTDSCIEAQKLITIARNNNITSKNDEIYRFFANCSGVSLDDDDNVSPYT